MTGRFALIGQPVAHSPSPQIHQGFARQLGLSLSYEKIEVAPADVPATLARLHDEGYHGLNVTLPHKVAALAASIEHAPRAALAGAANTLIRLESGWRADNTDGAGLVCDLKHNLRLALSGKRLLLLGAGGAARSAVGPLLDEKPAVLVVSSRTPWGAEKLAGEFKSHGPIRPSTHVALKGERFDLVINATSAGHQGESPRLPPGLVEVGAACYDMSYGKAFEPFRAWAELQGARIVVDGYGMLVEQAAAAFELWHGKRPATVPLFAALRAGSP